MKPAITFMIRLKNYTKYLLLLYVVTLSGRMQGQNIYDLNHSRQFAQYLMRSGQYRLAAGEWERVIFLAPRDTLAKLNLLQAFRQAGETSRALEINRSWFQDQLPAPFAREGLKSSILAHKYNQSRDFLTRGKGLSRDEISYYNLGISLLAWNGDKKTLQTPAHSEYPGYSDLLTIRDEAQQIKKKSPALALGLSALVPGLGKVYAHDWKDGLLSLLFIGGNVLQAYRGFSKFGIQNAYGWIFGTLAVGFYGANLFGSWKSAKSYNLRQIDQINHETEAVLLSRY
ncbi:MAG: hypothetical protein J7L89_03175 [Bacteroidales bacterium]|nr:hypothetical protein [Bacteroidales bacterium]